MLKIIEQAPDVVKGIRHIQMWRCECECGNKITVSGRELRSMTTCGECDKHLKKKAKE